LLNDRVIPFFDSHDVKLLRVLTDRGSEYCGNPERTKTKSPQTNGICRKGARTHAAHRHVDADHHFLTIVARCDTRVTPAPSPTAGV
jgi:hypothetical protein